MASIPETLYARDGNAHLAYQVVGDNGPDLLFVPTATFPIDLLWDEPTVAGQLHRLASFSRLRAAVAGARGTVVKFTGVRGARSADSRWEFASNRPSANHDR
jgi:hypothetical protein